GSATRMLLCQSNLVAVATSSTNLLFLQTDLRRHQPAVHLAVSQATSLPTATVGNAFSYTLTVSNAAATAATNAWVLDSLPSDTTLVSAAGTASGSWQATNGLLSFSLGPLAPGGIAK